MAGADIERFESQAAEVLGAMKALFQEFERHLGEVVSAQRLASSEARTEATKARAALEDIARQARATAEAQRQAVAELRSGWQLHVAENSKAAGEEMAKRFGEQLTAGLTGKLATTAAAVETLLKRFEWRTDLRWVAGIALGIIVTILIGVSALTPGIRGLSSDQATTAMAAIAPCIVQERAHVCVAVEADKVVKGPSGVTLAAIKGM